MPYLKGLYYQAYHQDDPDRKPLVLLHGAGGDHLSWPSQVRRLAGFRVYGPDLPGHGKSKGSGLQRIGAYGEAVLSWMLALDLPRIFIAGHSMGGAVALWIARHHPELFHGLVLMSTGSTLPVNLSLIEELTTPQGFPTAVDTICRWSFSPKADSRLVENVKKEMLKTRPSVLGGDFRACDAYDLREELAELMLPTLILVGEEDKMTPVRFSEGLRDGIKGAELAVVRGAGHMLPLEEPDQVADQLQTFLEHVLSS